MEWAIRFSVLFLTIAACSIVNRICEYKEYIAHPWNRSCSCTEEEKE